MPLILFLRRLELPVKREEPRYADSKENLCCNICKDLGIRDILKP